MWKTVSLTPFVLSVVRDQYTEPPETDRANSDHAAGTYLCRQCGLALFRQLARFHAGCGWPAFHQAVPGHVAERRDRDGVRDEIQCHRCAGHLGHVFRGEGFTPENLRHCVNSVSLDAVASATVMDSEEAIFAAGCFWGVEHLFQSRPGVLKTEVGYTGGQTPDPTYNVVCRGETGHYEAVRVVYDPTVVSYEKLVQYFYEIHDPAQASGQGPDIGAQYRSAIFCYDEAQKKIAERVTDILKGEGVRVTTAIQPVRVFWPAEASHQAYYKKTGKAPYCHIWTQRF